MSDYDPLRDESEHVSIGKVEMRLGYIAHCLGVTPAALARIRDGWVVVPRKLLAEAHACMRECGWQLAPASAMQGDGILELAVAEVEERFSDMLAAAPEAASHDD